MGPPISPDAPPDGDGFHLRPWRVEDAEWYVNSRDEDVFRWTTERRDLTVEQTREAIGQVNVSPDVHSFAIADSSNETVLGNIALVLEEKDRRVGEIMYWLAPSGRGRGIATKAVKLLCGWAFKSLGLRRITLKTRPGNVRSQQVAERAGFRRLANANGGDGNSDDLWFELIPEATGGRDERLRPF